MLMVISPAKTLDYESPLATQKTTQPDFLEDACELIDQLKDLEPHDISNLMGISDKLAKENVRRYKDWSTPFTPENARPAAFPGEKCGWRFPAARCSWSFLSACFSPPGQNWRRGSGSISR